jgi:hypothetical protein
MPASSIPDSLWRGEEALVLGIHEASEPALRTIPA